MFKTRNLFVVLLVLLVISALPGFLLAQITLPYSEVFNYSLGNLVGNDGWNRSGTNDQFPIQVTSGNLSYTGLPTSTGNKVVVLNAANYEDAGFDIVPVGSQSEASSVYVSFILNVINTGNTTGDYFQHISSAGGTSTNFHSRVFVRQAPLAGALIFNIGVSNQNNDTIQFETTNRPVTATVFIVVSYDFVPGTQNDTSRVWINPPLGQSSPPAPDLIASAVGSTNTDLASAGRINFRQGSGDTSLSLEVDEMRIGTSWAYVTPISVSAGVYYWEFQ